jgi:predicted nuclease with RNAse H fold
VATHAQRFGTLDLPRPARAALPLLALALLALALEADPPLRLAGLAAAALFALAGVARATRARAELGTVRRTADRLILSDAHAAEASDVALWRTHELVSPASRQGLARELEQTIRRLDAARLPSASPLRRGLARRHEDLLRRLQERMLDGRPVAARGVLLLRRLLREAGSPLYDAVDERELSRALATVLVELEP